MRIVSLVDKRREQKYLPATLRDEIFCNTFEHELMISARCYTSFVRVLSHDPCVRVPTVSYVVEIRRACSGEGRQRHRRYKYDIILSL